MTPEQIEQLFVELRQAAVGTRVKFHLQDSTTTVEGIIIDPPGEQPENLRDGVYLQDVEDYTQIYCLCPDQTNGAGNILVHTFVQGASPARLKGPSPEYSDEVSQRLREAEDVHAGGGAVGASTGAITGTLDTSVPPPG